jgi:hypothetical protein
MYMCDHLEIGHMSSMSHHHSPPPVTITHSREQIEELDDQFDDTFKMLLGQASAKAEAAAREAERAARAAKGKPQQDQYDRLVRELTFEARGRATDRMKTPEERAREEKEKLEALEAERVRRMTSSRSAHGDSSLSSAAEASVEYLATVHVHAPPLFRFFSTCTHALLPSLFCRVLTCPYCGVACSHAQ